MSKPKPAEAPQPAEEPVNQERKTYPVPKDPPLQNPNEMQVIITALEEQRNAAQTTALQNKVEAGRWQNCFYQLVQEHGALKDAAQNLLNENEDLKKKLAEAETLLANVTETSGTVVEGEGMPATDE